MKGSQYVAKFLESIGTKQVYIVQGGACAFMLDSVATDTSVDYVCFQHEQAAAMAADAVWRLSGDLGVTFSTSGPGASNLITGIACSYYDSIPSLHITGQVNGKEVAQYRGAKVRQAGFQQMDIVSMVRPVIKYAVAVTDATSLKLELKRAVEEAYKGRMGPVLVDIPMDVQTEDVGDELLLPDMEILKKKVHLAYPCSSQLSVESTINKITDFFKGSKRPLVVFGAGPGLANTHKHLENWLKRSGIPFVASWSGMTFFNHDLPNYVGHFGVYGNRGGNFAIQNADNILVLGSRLDNRQRSGNPNLFAPYGKLLVLDIDKEELVKYNPEQYEGIEFDLRNLPLVLDNLTINLEDTSDWLNHIQHLKSLYFNQDTSSYAKTHNTLSPYLVVQKFSELMQDDAVLITDAGANHCWIYQMFYRTNKQYLMTSSGHYSMGYSLPAAIGSKLTNPTRQVVSFNGDGGIQMNIQELQTVKEYGLDIKVVVFNNYALGMIKQFQDSYMNSRYEATDHGKGPGNPDFEKIAAAYHMDYRRVTGLEEITSELLSPGSKLIEIVIDRGTLIEPKLEMGRPINDQFPYLTDEVFEQSNKFNKFSRIK